jgi:hypothetical protein
MQIKALAVAFAVISAVAAGPIHHPRQGAAGTSSGKPAGTQFITGNCGSDTDCESTCCDAKTGLCAAKLVAQEDGHGCGFDGSFASSLTGTSAAAIVGANQATATVASSAAASTGTQFITGACQLDSDCASGCCDAKTLLCAAFLVAQQDGHGCGGTAGTSLTSGSSAVAVAPVAIASTAASAPAASSTAAGTSPGKGPGGQFITGNCGSDTDCASGCCDAKTGLCAAKLVAEGNGHGCGFDGFAARRL